MKQGPRYKVPFRRRREARTDYRSRYRLLQSRLPRVVVRKSLRNTIVQVVEFSSVGDQVIATAFSKELAEFEWKENGGNLPSAYLTGYLAGKRTLAASRTQCVLDVGLAAPTPGSSFYAAMQGMIDAGVTVPHGEGLFPDPSRLTGKHIREEVPMLLQAVKGRIDKASGGKA